MSQLAFSFDIEADQIERRPPSKIDRKKPRQTGDPYHPFDAGLARQTILEPLRNAGGQWVRRMTLHRATGMRPHEVGRVLAELVSTGVIEENKQHPIIHPMHGHMGTTRAYRIAQEGQSHE